MFDRMKAAAALQGALKRQAAIDARAVEDARITVDNLCKREQQAKSAHQAAKGALEFAKAKAHESQKRAEATLIKPKSHKKQRTAFTGPSPSSTTAAEGTVAENATAEGAAAEGTAAEGAAAAEGVADAQDAEADDAENWRDWPLSRWRKHETELEKRRAVKIDGSNTDKTRPPRGDEKRGWKHHRRRGLMGCLQDWAQGSKYRVALMLAEMANEFGVVNEVAEHLNLKHSAEEVEKAKVDGYIVDRLRAVIHVYKRCLTEAMRIDLHVILGAVAPERKEKGDQDGMIKHVADRLARAAGRSDPGGRTSRALSLGNDVDVRTSPGATCHSPRAL